MRADVLSPADSGSAPAGSCRWSAARPAAGVPGGLGRPRRRPVSEGMYEAPVPERIELPSDVDLTLVGVPARQRSASPDLRSTQPEGAGDPLVKAERR